ncbi:MAG: class I SAM-dependent methyltransferase [Halobacteria archaeon]
MDPDDQEFWNELYDDERYPPEFEPSPFLREHIDSVPDGRALDVACGVGRNTVYLAEDSYVVDGLDFSDIALSKCRTVAREKGVLRDVNLVRCDLGSFSFPEEEYDLVLVNYHHSLDLLHSLKDSIAPGGFLVYVHHLRTKDEVDHGPNKPKVPNPDRFRFRSNELLHSCLDLRIHDYRERRYMYPDGNNSAVCELLAEKPGEDRGYVTENRS